MQGNLLQLMKLKHRYSKASKEREILSGLHNFFSHGLIAPADRPATSQTAAL